MARVLRFVRLEFEEGSSSKFHSTEVTATGDGRFLLQATWGRIGTAGTTQKVRPCRCRCASGAARDAACARRTGRGRRTSTRAPSPLWPRWIKATTAELLRCSGPVGAR